MPLRPGAFVYREATLRRRATRSGSGYFLSPEDEHFPDYADGHAGLTLLVVLALLAYASQRIQAL